jgi:hypothetical protein
VESPPAKPVDTANLKAYESHVAEWMEKLKLLKITADDQRCKPESNTETEVPQT